MNNKEKSNKLIMELYNILESDGIDVKQNNRYINLAIIKKELSNRWTLFNDEQKKTIAIAFANAVLDGEMERITVLKHEKSNACIARFLKNVPVKYLDDNKEYIVFDKINEKFLLMKPDKQKYERWFFESKNPKEENNVIFNFLTNGNYKSQPNVQLFLSQKVPIIEQTLSYNN